MIRNLYILSLFRYLAIALVTVFVLPSMSFAAPPVNVELKHCHKVPLELPGGWGCKKLQEVSNLPEKVWVDGSRLYITGNIEVDTFDQMTWAFRSAWVERMVQIPAHERVALVKELESGDVTALSKEPFRVGLHERGYARLLRDLKIREVVLNSPGGYAFVAYDIAAFVHHFNLETRVQQNSLCASACTFIFHFGAKRYASESALFMYHLGNLGSLGRQLDFKKDPKTWCVDPKGESLRLWCQHHADVRALELYFSNVTTNLTKHSQTLLQSGEDIYVAPKHLLHIGLVDALVSFRTHADIDSEALFALTEKFLLANQKSLSDEHKQWLATSFTRELQTKFRDGDSREDIASLSMQDEKTQAFWTFLRLQQLQGINFRRSLARTRAIFSAVNGGGH